MRDYSTLTDAEINAKLAEKMGYKRSESTPGSWLIPISKHNNAIRAFSPCTRRDDLAVVVALNTRAEMSMRNLLEEAWDADESAAQTFHCFLLTCPPRIIAEACLEVLEG